jgi:biotin carboxyl carrier protein
MSHAHDVEVVVHRDTDTGDLTLRVPAVGRLHPLAFSAGALLVPGAVIGTLSVLGQPMSLRLPPGDLPVLRFVAWNAEARRGAGFGTWIARVEEAAPPGQEGARSEGASDRATEDGFVLPAPMEGQFYRSPSPDAPPFAVPGQRLAPGDTVGLVEVMKFFYPLAWPGPGTVELVEMLAPDGRPIEAGAAVARLRRVDGEGT